MKKVYIGMCADLIHTGHVNLIRKACEYGSVTVGVLTDEAVSSYKRQPIIPFEQRKFMVENIKGIDIVVPQSTLDYRPNLIKYKPDYVLHGDDWKNGVQQDTRNQVIECLSNWDGKLIEVPYTEGVSTTGIIEKIKNL